MSAGSGIVGGVEKHKQEQGLSLPGLLVTPGSCRRAPVSIPAGEGPMMAQSFPCKRPEIGAHLSRPIFAF